MLLYYINNLIHSQQSHLFVNKTKYFCNKNIIKYNSYAYPYILVFFNFHATIELIKRIL